MSDHLTEEEQLENLKRLWKEYGTTILASVAIACAGYFGWNYWQTQQLQTAQASSSVYDQLVAAAHQPAVDTDAKKTARATVMHFAKELKKLDADSAYAVQGAFFAAQQAVASGDLDTAKKQLNAVLKETDNKALQQIARLRLARVLAAKGEHDAALALLTHEPVAGFLAEQSEVRGDVLRQKGDTEAAQTAYQKSLDALAKDQRQQRLVVKMKLDNLKTLTSAEEPSA